MPPELRVDLAALEEAVRRMGASTLDPHFELDSTTQWERIDIALKEGVEVDLDEGDVVGGLISWQGRQILLYIEDHKGGVEDALDDPKARGRKFHVADCSTLHGMRERGRYDRYKVTNDLGGEFYISGYDPHTIAPINGKARLRVCKICLKTLNYRDARRAFGPELDRLAEEFSIGRFFSEYSSYFKYLPAGRAKLDRTLFSRDWSTVAGRVKADRDFSCEQCGVELGSQKSMLKVIHANGNHKDNDRENLVLLCLDCERKRPGASVSFVEHGQTQDLARERRRQGLAEGSSWDEIFALADPAVHGLLRQYRSAGEMRPEIGYDVQDERGMVVSMMELAWPDHQRGVAIDQDDIHKAAAAGWSVCSVIDELERLA